jgi:hypothetical protein
MQALRSDLNTKAKNFENILLNFLQSLALENVVQSAQLKYLFSMQHERILHHVAFAFSLQPGQVPFKYFPHAPQYNPQ